MVNVNCGIFASSKQHILTHLNCRMVIFKIIYRVAIVIKIHKSPDRQEYLQEHQADTKSEERLAVAL